jgi:hypothetical protein
VSHVPLTDPSGRVITSWQEWTRPKQSYHWKPGRSAMELARAWFRNATSACPAELTALLDSHEATRGTVFTAGSPEHVTPLPQRGEGRNHDLWLRGALGRGTVTVCIEAKADEVFGERLGRQLQIARKRQPRTGAPERARALLRLLFGRECIPEAAPWREMRYQLITALAGTALQAFRDGSSAAVLVIHEFRSGLTDDTRLVANQRDLEAVLALLGPAAALVPDRLVGPILLPASDLLPDGMPLFVGKLITDVGPVRGADFIG